jgi:c(7)-type cytochrome triheme protein
MTMLTRGLLFFVVAMLGFLPSVVLAVPSGQTLTWPDGSQGPVEFEGEEHAEQGLKCASCHPLLFKMKKGSAKMTMNLLNKGQFCGACHNGKVAFSTNDPGKCHECHKRRKKHHQRKNKHHD